MNKLINTEELKAAFGYQRPGDLERCLRQQGVKFLQGKDGPVTTIDALNAALGISLSDLDEIPEPIEFAPTAFK
ncbi:hypothetical protein [Methylomonas koyamae]|uniref:hypothetical protein n=1 Tax=Methylomonas koyamae TaxID=702114 RepID=UPI0006D07EBA|nr:hypothetical protein [Methylomonas koyamae]BBL58510.1 hypothetical protein MKFW12EY_21230 [Methylomonas koyamae]